MKKRSSDMNWFPFWIDKWIFGSMRIECSLEQRAIWVDFLVLAAKDNGFIRANVDIPYPIEQLSGMLLIGKKKLENAIEFFVKNKKLTRLKTGVLYVTTWETYQFSDRHKRRVEKEINGKMSGNSDTMSAKSDTILKNNKGYNKKKKQTKKKRLTKTEIKKLYSKYKIDKFKTIEEFFQSMFDEMWNMWPKDGRLNKAMAKEKFFARCWEGKLEEIMAGANGYVEFLTYQEREENFKQRAMYPATFLEPKKARWKEYIGFKIKPKL